MNNTYIPCELCRQQIAFNDYISHVEICQHRSSILQLLNPMLNSFLGSNQLLPTMINITGDTAFNTSDSNMRVINIEDIVDSYELNNIIAELVGNVNHGVNNMDDAVVTVDINDVEEDSTCSICLEKFSEIDNCEIMKTTCDHYFCKECITKWFRDNRKCPLCLHDFNED